MQQKVIKRNNAQFKEINIATVDGAMDEMIKKIMEKKDYSTDIF